MSVLNGWTLFAHSLFLDQVERLASAIAARPRTTDGLLSADEKLLAAIRKLVFEVIPADPSSPAFRQGSTLGDGRKHWFRAKFGAGRFRLFFRYDARARVIVFAWLNDATTLRTYGAKSDAYAVFRRMLDKGHPPEDWPSLVAEAEALDRL